MSIHVALRAAEDFDGFLHTLLLFVSAGVEDEVEKVDRLAPIRRHDREDVHKGCLELAALMPLDNHLPVAIRVGRRRWQPFKPQGQGAGGGAWDGIERRSCSLGPLDQAPQLLH